VVALTVPAEVEDVFVLVVPVPVADALPLDEVLPVAFVEFDAALVAEDVVLAVAFPAAELSVADFPALVLEDDWIEC